MYDSLLRRKSQECRSFWQECIYKSCSLKFNNQFEEEKEINIDRQKGRNRDRDRAKESARENERGEEGEERTRAKLKIEKREMIQR